MLDGSWLMAQGSWLMAKEGQGRLMAHGQMPARPWGPRAALPVRVRPRAMNKKVFGFCFCGTGRTFELIIVSKRGLMSNPHLLQQNNQRKNAHTAIN